MNVRDSEVVAALLETAGYEPAVNENDADIIIINSCTVRGKAEDKALGKSGLLCASKRKRPGLIVGLMGCVVQRMGEEIFDVVPNLDFIVGTRRHGSIPRLVARAAAGESRIAEVGSNADVDDLSDAHLDGNHAAFVTILLGCNRRCTYCIVPDVRGPEYSRPPHELISEITRLAERGVKEITLLGQSVMNYGRATSVWPESYINRYGIREPFARLLSEVASIKGIQRIRFTSGHPSGCTDELVKTIQAFLNICCHLHLPMQSGSDKILAAMRRGYTAAQYADAVKRLRDAMPDFAVTTDIIVGFPDETEADFDATRTMMQQAEFDNAFIFKYSPRPGTPAALLPDNVTDENKKLRNQILLADQDARGIAINRRLVGQTVEVLAEGPSLRNATRWSGRSGGNKIVIFDKTPQTDIGDIINVKISSAAAQTLYGEIVNS